MTPKRWRALAIGALAGLFAVLVWVHRPSRFTLALTADPPGVLREVRQLRELVTIRYSIQKVTGLTENKVPVGSESILLIVQARVLGGINLSELKDKDIRMAGGRQVEIKLPPSRILHVEFDEKNTKVWDRSKTWWTPWVPYDIDLEKKARLAALDSIQQEALDMGILLDAQVNAQNLVRALLHPLGIEKVSFRASQS